MSLKPETNCNLRALYRLVGHYFMSTTDLRNPTLYRNWKFTDRVDFRAPWAPSPSEVRVEKTFVGFRISE